MSEIQIKMGAIYQASHEVLPAKATEFAGRADTISGAIEPIVAQVALAGTHPIADDLADIAVELFLHLRAMVRTFNDTAVALDAIADDFVRVDDQAAAWFAQNQQFLGDPELPTVPSALRECEASMSSSLIDHLEPLFDELAGLLGELAGNEAAWEIRESQITQLMNVRESEGWSAGEVLFTMPGTYGFELSGAFMEMNYNHPNWETDEVTNPRRREIVQQAFTQVWHRARDSWADSAVPTVYRAASRNIWEPDPSTMATQVSQLSFITRWLAAQVFGDHADWTDGEGAPEWLTDLRTHWPATSQSSASFYDFWDDVNDKCGLYLHAAARLTASSAQVATAISDFQTNLREATEATRERVIEAPHPMADMAQPQWIVASGTVSEGNDGAASVLGGISLAAGVVSLFPPAAVVAGPISVATGFMSYIVGGDKTPMVMTTVATADEIHSAFLDDLTGMVHELEIALNQLKTMPQDSGDSSTTGNIGLGELAEMVVDNHDD